VRLPQQHDCCGVERRRVCLRLLRRRGCLLHALIGAVPESNAQSAWPAHSSMRSRRPLVTSCCVLEMSVRGAARPWVATGARMFVPRATAAAVASVSQPLNIGRVNVRSRRRHTRHASCAPLLCTERVGLSIGSCAAAAAVHGTGVPARRGSDALCHTRKDHCRRRRHALHKINDAASRCSGNAPDAAACRHRESRRAGARPAAACHDIALYTAHGKTCGADRCSERTKRMECWARQVGCAVEVLSVGHYTV
jgi:hypothetical protein